MAIDVEEEMIKIQAHIETCIDCQALVDTDIYSYSANILKIDRATLKSRYLYLAYTPNASPYMCGLVRTALSLKPTDALPDTSDYKMKRELNKDNEVKS